MASLDVLCGKYNEQGPMYEAEYDSTRLASEFYHNSMYDLWKRT